MALARSASGPGGLSINTSSANLFGSTSQPPAGGLFGTTSTSTSQLQTMQSTTGSSLFGNTGASTPKPGGLFGNTTTPATQPQQTGGGLFGNTSTATAQPQQQQQTAGGLFGNAAAATSQPQQTTGTTGGGLFGNAATSTAKPGGLFGNAAAAQPQQQTGGGLFGNAANTNTAGGLFGASTATSQPQQQTTGGGLFGTNTAPQQSSTQTGGLFGTNATNTAPQQSSMHTGGALFAAHGLGPSGNANPLPKTGGLFGSTMPPLGASTANGSVVPGVRIDVSNLRGTTRFNDIQEDLQKEIARVDELIQGFIQQKNQLDAFMPAHGEMLENIPNDVKFVKRKYEGVRSALQADAEAIETARALTQQDAESGQLSWRAIDNMNLPSQYHTSGLWSGRQPNTGSANNETDGQDLVGFFSKTAQEMDGQLKKYEKNLSEIEMHMHGVQGSLIEELQKMMAAKNGGNSGSDERLAELGGVLRDFELSILKIAGEVGTLREGMTQLQLGDFLNHGGDRHGVY